MQQAYPGGPMYTIPVHWTPFIDPSFIPGETALTPLDPAFTHVIDPKSLPIDPVHILPVQHDAAGCPVQVQVRVSPIPCGPDRWLARHLDGPSCGELNLWESIVECAANWGRGRRL